LHVVRDEEVPKFLGVKKISLHQTGFQEVLATAELLGSYPRHLLLIGVQPVELDDFGGSLREEVRAQIQPAIALALEYLAGFGIQPVAEGISPDPEDALSITRYESERPDTQLACRIGDARFMALDAVENS
jgi:hydrogenase maturation protease